MKNHKVKFLALVLSAAFAVLGCGLFSSVQGENTSLPPEQIQPTNTPIPGWVKFEGKGVEIWLPESYVGGNISEDLELVVSRLKELGPDFEEMAKTVEQNPDSYALWALDTNMGSSGFMTNITITTEQVLSVITLDTYLDAIEKQLPAQFEITKREKISFQKYEAGRLEIDVEISEVSIKELMYVIKDGNDIWVITFATGFDEYDTRLIEFGQIVETFHTISQ